MNSDHECWWTRRRESEISHDGESLLGAGVPAAVLKQTAVALGNEWSEHPAKDDVYGTEFSLGSRARGKTHDGCFFEVSPTSPALEEALLRSVLQLHAGYLGRSLDERAILTAVLGHFGEGTTMRIRANPRRQHLSIRAYPFGSGLIARIWARRVRVNCLTDQHS